MPTSKKVWHSFSSFSSSSSSSWYQASSRKLWHFKDFGSKYKSIKERLEYMHGMHKELWSIFYYKTIGLACELNILT